MIETVKISLILPKAIQEQVHTQSQSHSKQSMVISEAF
jgi:hypothetical protein